MIDNDFTSLTLVVIDFTKSNPSASSLPNLHYTTLANNCQVFFQTIFKFLGSLFYREVFFRSNFYYSKLSIKSQVLKKVFCKKVPIENAMWWWRSVRKAYSHEKLFKRILQKNYKNNLQMSLENKL